MYLYKPLKFLEEFELDQVRPLLFGDLDPLLSRKPLFEEFFAYAFAHVPVFHQGIMVKLLFFRLLLQFHFLFYVFGSNNIHGLQMDFVDEVLHLLAWLGPTRLCLRRLIQFLELHRVLRQLHLHQLHLHLLLYFDVKLLGLPLEKALIDAHGPVPVRDFIVPYLAAYPPFKNDEEVLRRIIVLVHFLVGI